MWKIKDKGICERDVTWWSSELISPFPADPSLSSHNALNSDCVVCSWSVQNQEIGVAAKQPRNRETVWETFLSAENSQIQLESYLTKEQSSLFPWLLRKSFEGQEFCSWSLLDRMPWKAISRLWAQEDAKDGGSATFVAKLVNRPYMPKAEPAEVHLEEIIWVVDLEQLCFLYLCNFLCVSFFLYLWDCLFMPKPEPAEVHFEIIRMVALERSSSFVFVFVTV